MPPKSGHHRAKNVDYDDEDVYNDDYYEEEEAGDGMLGCWACIEYR
jgi:elongation factor 1 alpha-like protein